MTPIFLTAVVGLTVIGPVNPSKPGKAAPAVFEGKVMPLTTLLELQGVKADPDTDSVVLVSAGGTVYTLVRSEPSRLLFHDTALHGRQVRLTARPVTGSQLLVVEKVQTVKDGKVYDVDYWCENCQLAATEPGKCKCCGSDTVLRELPAK